MGGGKRDATGQYRGRIYGKYASGFQAVGSAFDAEGSRRWGRAYDHYLRGWLPERRDAAIADLACGRGALLHFLLERGYACVSGVDLSPEQVQLARQVVPDVVEGNVLDFLSERPGAFDLLIALDLVEHLTKDEALRFLDLCRQALKPGGRLVLQTPNAESPFSLGVRYGDLTHEIMYSPILLSRLMEMAGFAPVACREMGPAPRGYSVLSTVRSLLWQGCRAGVMAWNIIETGGKGSGIYTRVFLVSGECPK